MERLEATHPVELKLHLFGRYDTTSSHLSPDLTERAVRGEPEATDTLLDSVAEWTDKHELVRRLLQLGADEVKARLVGLLSRWYDHVFEPQAHNLRPELPQAGELLSAYLGSSRSSATSA